MFQNLSNIMNSSGRYGLLLRVHIVPVILLNAENLNNRIQFVFSKVNSGVVLGEFYH